MMFLLHSPRDRSYLAVSEEEAAEEEAAALAPPQNGPIAGFLW